MTAAVVVVAVLVLQSNREIRHKNGFRRRFYNGRVTRSAQLEMPFKVRSLCKGRGICFDTDTAGVLLITGSRLENPHRIQLEMENIDSVNSLFTTYVDSPLVYIFAGNIPAVIRIDMHTHQTVYQHFPKHTFTRAAFIDNGVYAFRSYKKISGTWEQQFVKANAGHNEIITEKNVSERTGDAGFSTDGLLHYDEMLYRLLYVNYYRNHFICIDTNMELVYHSHTIDTNSTFRITAGVSGGSITNTSPVRDVNFQSCVNRGKLFIISALQADNESQGNFEKNSVIDVYSIATGRYDSSFYVPFFHGQRLKEMKVSNRCIIILYEGYAVVYTLPPGC